MIYQLLPKGYNQEGKKRIVNSVGELLLFSWASVAASSYAIMMAFVMSLCVVCSL